MRGVAVCCGFNGYDVRPLDRAVNDAAILYAKLTESGAFNTAPDLIGRGEMFTQRTSANAVLAAFTRAAMSSAELIWFSFSGHAMVSDTGELRLLLPGWRRDASAEHQRTYSIGASEIENVLRSRLADKKFVVVLDACYSGAFGAGAVSRDVDPGVREVEQRLAGAGAVVISSCARDQLAYDCHPAVDRPNGAFTAAVIEVLDDHVRTGAALSVLQLFQEARDRIATGQQPTLYVNGLSDDFLILERAARGQADGIVPLSAEVPAALTAELRTFLHSVVQIHRRRRVGLVRATRQLQRLAAEFYRYGDDAFVVSGHDASVIEAFDNARTCIVGCTTPAYVGAWRQGGAGLLATHRNFVVRHGGRVVRFFFVPDDFESRVPGVLDVVRDHVLAGVLAVVVNVDSFGPSVLHEVFKDPRPSDLSSLECAFVDGRIFLKTHFVANGDPRIELDQRPARCQHEYKAQLRPFLVAGGALFLADLRDDRGAGVALHPLQVGDIDELREQLDADLGVAA